MNTSPAPKNPYHAAILLRVQENSGQPTKHTFSDGYLGNVNPRYPIAVPALRRIAKDWSKANSQLSASLFQELVTSLIHGKSSTEKSLAGILLDYAAPAQRTFDPQCFDEWLDHLHGWAEVDSVCTGNYTIAAIPTNFPAWKKLLVRLSKSKNINKRRASLVFFCSPLRHSGDVRLASTALGNIDRLKHEREILITKAISWVLRSMVKYHKKRVHEYVRRNKSELPAIAVRETMTKIKTGKKTNKKPTG